MFVVFLFYSIFSQIKFQLPTSTYLLLTEWTALRLLLSNGIWSCWRSFVCIAIMCASIQQYPHNKLSRTTWIFNWTNILGAGTHGMSRDQTNTLPKLQLKTDLNLFFLKKKWTWLFSQIRPMKFQRCYTVHQCLNSVPNFQPKKKALNQ